MKQVTFIFEISRIFPILFYETEQRNGTTAERKARSDTFRDTSLVVASCDVYN